MRRVLRADPGQEYFVYLPENRDDDAPLLVSVHGLARNALEHARLLAPLAEEHGVVLLAPHFDDDRFGDYQRLGHDQPGGRPDIVLNEIVEEAAWLTGVDAAQIHLFGFRGGAQFAHRYAMAHPLRVAGAVLVAAGWYTFPDPTERYPYGLLPSRKHAVINFDPEGFLRVPITVLGSPDDDSDDTLRRTDRCDEQQGVTRRERAQRWVRAMRAAAEAHFCDSVVKFEEFSGESRSFKDFAERHGDRIFELLFEKHDAASASAANDDAGPHEEEEEAGSGEGASPDQEVGHD